MRASNNSLKRLVHDEYGTVYSLTASIRNNVDRSVDYEIPRKIFHALVGGIVPLGYLMLDLSREVALGILLPAMILLVGSDLLRLVHKGFNAFYLKRFGALMRQHEAHSLTTSTYFVLASFFVIMLFDKTTAIVALLFLAIGDPVAALFGRMFGQVRLIDGKSLEGSIACFQTCLVIGLIFLSSPWAALVAALVATLAELIPLPVNDNIRIPVISAFILSLLV
ncbi:hypothetical protein JW905_01285 [bacterium]|nr:hypothetical protein [candidate division CSSED10-310 bacterium]